MGHPTVLEVWAALTLVLASAAPLGAQSDSSRRVDKTFFTKRDLVVLGAGVGASAAVAIFDERIADWWQGTGIQGSESRRDAFELLTNINETPLTVLAAATFGVARLAGWKTIADASLHTTEALVLTVTASELIRAPLGRARPRASPDNAFEFEAGAGFTKFDHRAYPSLHAAAAFAAAAAITGEVRAHRPGAVKVVAPIAYTLAMVPGITRMYLNQHWASDVVSGAILGGWLGAKTVRYAHAHSRSKLDRWLLGVTVLPDGRGGVAVSVTLPKPRARRSSLLSEGDVTSR